MRLRGDTGGSLDTTNRPTPAVALRKVVERPFPATKFQNVKISPLPGDLRRDYGSCDYDIRHNLTGQYVYELPVKVRSHAFGHALNGWQVSGSVFWHSWGSVLSPEHAIFG
jgi:hypothetical protein